MTILEVSGLQKTYGSRRVVDGVDFHVDEGEIVGLLGPNGAGKTTTFRMTMGMVPAEAGVVKLGDEDVTRLPMYKRARKGMAYLAQEASVFTNLTVRDNLMSILETQRLDRHGRQARLMEILDDLGLARLADSYASTLSGGERRRLEIGRALVANPRIILLDEPFAGVDPKSSEDIQKIISEFRRRGISILITDHNVFETFTIVDRAYIICDGRVLRHGTPQELVEDEDARRLYLGDKFAEYGEAFKRLRQTVEQKSREEAAAPAGSGKA